MRRAFLALPLALAALVGLAPAAAADPPRPANLTVVGGEGAWRAQPLFTLEWSIPGSSAAVASVHYRIRDPQGAIVESRELDWAASEHQLRVPSAPGVYTASVWFEDSGGRAGPAAEARLRFDDSRPGSVTPLPPTGWIGRDDFPLAVPVAAPPEPPSPSGLRGYAYSVSTRAGVPPCAAADLCTEAETVAADGDSFSLPAAPEGAARLRVVAVSGAGVPSAPVGEATLRVDLTDPTTRLSGLPAGWARGPLRLTATASDSGSGMGGERAFAAIQVDDRAPNVAAGSLVEATLIEQGVHRIAYYGGDAAGNSNDGAWVNGRRSPPPSVSTARIDRTPPDAGFLPQDPADPELIRVRVRDALAGPDPGRGWIGVRPLGSPDRFRRLPAAPPGEDELRARWDSAAYPLGAYEFRAEARDAAGNAVATERRESGAAMVLANPLKTTTTLRAGFGGAVLRWHRCRRRGRGRRCRLLEVAEYSRRPAQRTVPYGRGLALSGKLVAGVSAAPGPRSLRIVERFALGAHPATRTTTVLTGPDGSFATRLAPGPSREIRAVYDGDPAHGPSTGSVLQLSVRSGVRFGASSRVARVGGPPLVFRGKVAAGRGEVPTDGVAVQLQFRLPGLPWEEFRTVRADRRGRFRLAYRFSDDDSRGARFQFRAFVPAQSEWPYEPGSSRPLTVLGR